MATLIYAYSDAAGKVTLTKPNPLNAEMSRGTVKYEHDGATGKVKETKN